MPDRFVLKRWGAARRRIHAMRPGQRITFHDPETRFCTFANDVSRLNDAYDGQRIWRKVKRGNRVTIWRER